MISIGDADRIEQEGPYLRMTTAAADVRLAMYNDTTFRVQICRKGAPFRETSYACPQLPEPRRFDFSRKGDTLTAETPAMRLVIGTRPFRVRLETPDGTVLSEDDPGLGTVWDGTEVTAYKTLQPGERFFGLGEKTGGLDKAGKQYRNWNTDAFGYGQSTDPLYVSCPFYMGLSHDRPYGIFLNNAAETVFNFGAANDRFSFFSARRGEMDYFLFAGPEPEDILRDYTALTGRSPLPPLWSLGFQQCRYSYYPASEILRVAKTFREREIPADVLYFDIHYMQDYKVFTWHKGRFPDPKGLISELKELGFKTVVILDPGVKDEEGYEAFDEGSARDVFVKYPDGKPYRGAAWPGWCRFPDFTDPEVRAWWADSVAKMGESGIDGFWNDMNEPAVWGHFTPDILKFSLDGAGGNHKDAHNVYGMQMARATREGAEKALGGKRPFILTRATFSGGQRDSAVWTGDNYSDNTHMLLGARMVSGMGISGFPFAGNDVGGFTGDAGSALYKRWIAYAAFHPMMRAHSMINSKAAEPWSFGEECTEVARNYIRLRYRLLPHLYSLFYEASQNGMPPVRSLLLRYYREWKVFSPDFENQFLLGDHLLICPVRSDAELAKVYLPEGRWYNFFNDTVSEGGQEHLVELQRDTIPVFAKAGGIIPEQNAVQHTDAPSDGLLRIHLYAGGSGRYTLYEDDGITAGGPSVRRTLSFDGRELTIGRAEGEFTSVRQRVRIYLHGARPEKAAVNDVAEKIIAEDFRFLDAISNFDPYENYPEAAKVIENLSYAEAGYGPEEIRISFD